MTDYKDNKRYFTCKDELINLFDDEISKDERFQNRSEAIRYLMRKYIEERQQLRNAKK